MIAAQRGAEEPQGRVVEGKYRILSELGHGAMGVVYRAEQLDVEGTPQRQVALKTMRPEFSSDPDFARRFLREVRVAMQLHDSHIVTVYDSGKDEAGHLYYSMELVRGQTLRQILRQGPLPCERAVGIAMQICEGLAEAHTLPEPVIHRDLKPVNIFIEQRRGEDWVKIGDFGIAKVLSQHTAGLTRPGEVHGTPLYMAPELWLGKDIDGRTDLYALGIVLYEMLAGKVPFSADQGLEALIYQHLHQPPPPLPAAIPARIRAQVQQLLAKNRQDRPCNALSVRRALASTVVAEDQGDTVVLGEEGFASAATVVRSGMSRRENTAEAREGATEEGNSAALTRRFSYRAGIAIAGCALLAFGLFSFFFLRSSQVREGWQSPVVPLELEGEIPQNRTGTDAVTMIEIPSGAFWMGCNEKVDRECFDDEKPGQLLSVNTFQIDRHEVTVEAYRWCVQAGQCSRDSFTTSPSCNWGKEGRTYHPINCVSWEQAQTYCEWGGKRLPTEAEWEKAARGTDGRIYPWGNEWDPKKTNTDRSEDGFSETSPVDSFPAGASPYGVLDMSGNVFEWTADWYDGERINRSLRGGSWNYTARDVRASNRYGEVPHSHRGDVGFRCVR